MLRQYPCLAASLALSTMLAVAGKAHAATTVTPDARPTAAETAAARRALPGDFTDAVRFQHHPLVFTVGRADLNGDGRPDLIIHYTFANPFFCGAHGCPAYALLATPGGYGTQAVQLAYFPETSVTILDSSHHGMHDLRYDDSTYVFRWNGTAYH